MAARKLEVLFLGDTKDLQRSIARIQSTAGTFADRTRREQRGLRSWSRLVGGGLLAGTAALGVAAKTAIGAAEDSEVSTAKLTAQMKAQGFTMAAHSEQIDAVVQRVSRLSGLDDEDLQDGFTTILRATGSIKRSLALVGLTADLARAKNLDTVKAAQLVAKVAGGNVGVLKRYGIVIDKDATSAQALAILERKFHGQAEAYGNTTQGAYDKFQVAKENLNEAIGSRLLPAFTSLLLLGIKLVNRVAPIVTGIGRAVTAVAEWVRKLAPVIDGVRGIVGAVKTGAGWIFDRILTGAKFVKVAGDAAGWLLEKIGVAFRSVFVGAFKGIGAAMITGLLKGLDAGAIVKFLLHELGGAEKLARRLFGSVTGFIGGLFGGGGGVHAIKGGGSVAAAILAMTLIAKQHLPYTYGGGHGRFGVGNPGFDCSGYVSVALGILGAIRAPMAVREPMASALLRGDGKRVTVGIRGSSGQNAHTMIKLDNQYFESGGGHGPAQVGGWDGAFEHFHPKGFATGGKFTAHHPTRFLVGEKGRERVQIKPVKKKAKPIVIHGSVLHTTSDVHALAATVAFHASAPAKKPAPKKKQPRVQGATTDRRRQMLDLMQRIWTIAAPFYGRPSGSFMPRVKFTGDTMPIVGASVNPYDNVRDIIGSRAIYWPDWVTADYLTEAAGHGRDDAMLGMLIHEWAHYFQRPNLPLWQAEGGAQAFARRAAPAIYAQAGIPFGNLSFGADQYPAYVARVVHELGEHWIMRDQFWTGTDTGLAHF